MWNIKNEIIQAAKKLNIKILEISKIKTEITINKIINKYADGKKNNFIWENFKKEFSVKNKNAWKWIEEISYDQEIIMFFNPSDESVAFRFCNEKDVTAILKETFGFEFYLTNKTMDYVICFNHHDVLITCGKAMKWLKKYIERSNNKNKP